MNNPYKTLGVEKSATQEEIKKAYYKKSMKYHPDKNNGKQSEKFIELNEAYKILMDPATKKEFDETGQVRKKLDKQQAINQILQTVFLEIISKNSNFLEIDIFEAINKSIEYGFNLLDADIQRFEAQKNNFQEMAKRIKLDAPNRIFSGIISDKIKEYEGNILVLKERYANGMAAMEYIKKCQYDKKERQAMIDNFGPFTVSFG